MFNNLTKFSNLIMGILIAFVLISCSKGNDTHTEAKYQAELLFEENNCKVWRFKDDGKYQYYSQCGFSNLDIAIIENKIDLTMARITIQQIKNLMKHNPKNNLPKCPTGSNGNVEIQCAAKFSSRKPPQCSKNYVLYSDEDNKYSCFPKQTIQTFYGILNLNKELPKCTGGGYVINPNGSGEFICDPSENYKMYKGYEK